MKGITPSTQVGRLSGSHSDIGLLLTQFPGRRKVVEPKGEESEELKVFEQKWFRVSAEAAQLHEEA